LRLFCFSFAGGTAAHFFTWLKRFDQNIEVCPVEYPGRGSRWKDGACATLDELVETIVGTLSCHLHQPYALFGHSFGAIVAFEFARLMNSSGSPLPARLFVSAARAPHLPGDEELHKLPETEFLTRLMGYGGVPQEALGNKDLLTTLLPVVRHDFRLFEEYRFRNGDPLPLPISVFGGLQDSKVPVPDLLAWSRHTSKSFRSRFFQGKHFFLFDEQCCVINDIQNDIKASALTSLQEGAG
jgi:medium-chain acyl-[acyl-carrier-protein] hydrolase